MDRLGTRTGFAIAIVVWSVAAMAHAEAPTFGGGRGAILGVVGLTYCGFGRRLHRRPVRARPRRGRQLPGGDQDRRGVVPEARARARDRHLQLGHQRRRARDAARRAVDHAHLGLGLGVHRRPAPSGSSGWSLWLPLYGAPETHPRVSAAELALIRSDPPEPRSTRPVAPLLPHRQTWAFAIGKFMTDPIWWLYSSGSPIS